MFVTAKKFKNDIDILVRQNATLTKKIFDADKEIGALCRRVSLLEDRLKNYDAADCQRGSVDFSNEVLSEFLFGKDGDE